MVGVFSTSLLCIGCGYALKLIYNRISHPINKSSIRNMIFIIIVGLGLLSLHYFTNEEIHMASNSLVNPMYFLCAGILGFVFVYKISTLIDRLHIGEVLSYCGKKSIWILFLHLLSFKLVAILQILTIGLDMHCISKHPIPAVVPYWWMLYTIIGVTIPLLIGYLFHTCKSKLLFIMHNGK